MPTPFVQFHYGQRGGGRASHTLPSLLLGAFLVLTSFPAAAADEGAAKTEEVVITEKARGHFRAGVNLLQDPDGPRYEEAYAQFKAAYAESPSWKVLNNFGITAMMLEKDGEAIDAFRKYLEEGTITPEEEAQTKRDLETLEASVVTLTIRGVPEGLRITDQRSTNQGGNITNHYLMQGSEIVLRIRPGQHKITARLSGYEDSVWDLAAGVATAHEHSFSLVKAVGESGAAATPVDSGTERHRPVPTSVWVGAGVTGALLAGAIGTGVVALGKNADYDEANETGDPSAEDLRGDVKTFNLVTDILIGGAVVGGAVTAVLYFTRPEVSKGTALRFEPIVGTNVAALRVSGSF